MLEDYWNWFTGGMVSYYNSLTHVQINVLIATIFLFILLWVYYRPSRMVREMRQQRRLSRERAEKMKRDRENITDMYVSDAVTEMLFKLVDDDKLTAREAWRYSHMLGHKLRIKDLLPGNLQNRLAQTKGILTFHRKQRETGKTAAELRVERKAAKAKPSVIPNVVRPSVWANLVKGRKTA